MDQFSTNIAFFDMIYDETVPITRWIHEYYEYGKHMILECTQQPGEVIFVPQGYRHAVVNIKDSIGIASEV